MTYQNVLTALADPTRRGIFEALTDKPQSVRDIANDQTVSRPAVSQHLKVLQGANLVSAQPKGKRHLYVVKRDGLNELRDYLDGFWSDALTAFSDEITRRKMSD